MQFNLLFDLNQQAKAKAKAERKAKAAKAKAERKAKAACKEPQPGTSGSGELHRFSCLSTSLSLFICVSLYSIPSSAIS